MRAVTIRDTSLTVEDHPDPIPGAGEVLVRVRAAGLNGADMMQRRGRYPAPPGVPQDIPGLELAGEVLARGTGAERFNDGDRVMGIVAGGAQAELAVVHERVLTPSSPRPGCARASGCWSTVAPAVSARPRSSSGARLGPG
jgi:NADPH2:quinone reductase